MTDDDHNEQSDGRRRPRRRLSLKLAIGALVFAVGGAFYAYRGGSETDHLSTQVRTQQQQIETISKDVAVLKAFSAKSSAEPESPPGICVCKEKDPGSQVRKKCLAKNETCDDESQEVCEAQNPGFDC